MNGFTRAFIVVCLVTFAGAFLVGATIKPVSVESYNLKTKHFGNPAETVSATPLSINLTDLTTFNGRILAGFWTNGGASKHISIHNQSVTTSLYYALDSAGVSDLTTTTTHAGLLEPGCGKTFDFGTSLFGMRLATGAGAITVDWEATF